MHNDYVWGTDNYKEWLSISICWTGESGIYPQIIKKTWNDGASFSTIPSLEVTECLMICNVISIKKK